MYFLNLDTISFVNIRISPKNFSWFIAKVRLAVRELLIGLPFHVCQFSFSYNDNCNKRCVGATTLHSATANVLTSRPKGLFTIQSLWKQFCVNKTTL